MLQTRRRCCCTTQTSDGHEAWWYRMGRTITSPASHEVGQNLHLYCLHSTCPCMHVRAHTRTHTLMHTYRCTTCTHLWTHIHAHTHTCLWTHTHAHTYSFRAKRCTHYCTAYTLSTYSCPCAHTHTTHYAHLQSLCTPTHTWLFQYRLRDIFHAKKCFAAYEILGNPVKRRSYDSVDPEFDDTVPAVTQENKNNFFAVFRPVFEANARWDLKSVLFVTCSARSLVNCWHLFCLV